MRNYLLNRHIKKNNLTHKYLGWGQIKTIALVYDVLDGDHRPEVFELIDILKKEGKTIHLLGYHYGKKPKENPPTDTYFKQDTTLIRSPKRQVRESMPGEVDLLIDWSKAPTSPNDFLAARIKSGLKLGIDRNLPCFDITIKGHEFMPDKVIEEVMKYIKMINK
jgi:hypothetical protein